MSSINLNNLTAIISKEVERLGGQLKAMEACDRMYSATFRSKAFPLSEAKDYCSKSLILELAIKLYYATTGHTAPIEPPEDCECFSTFELYSDDLKVYGDSAIVWFYEQYPLFKLTPETSIVSFCNYKGEGEDGIGLFLLHKDLPVFTSKSNSFGAVNGY